MIRAICREILMTPYYAEGEKVRSIYFGGGTPSILTPGQIQQVLHAIKSRFTLADNAEITLEANPDDISPEILNAWALLGINRLSVGVQSFNEAELNWMNRAHHATQSLSSLKWIRESGIQNFSIDLIYGSNFQTDEQLNENLETLHRFSVPHISCYGLTVEPKTRLQHLIATGKATPVDEQKQARQFLQVMQWMKANGYEHYEVSNYALPGMRSRHNSSYWNGQPYYGFGPSAHSFNGKNIRSWNIRNNALYIKQIEQGRLPKEQEELTPTQRLNEFVMTGLRTIEGLDLQKIETTWGIQQRSRIEAGSLVYLENELLLKTNDRLILTNNGMLMADGIAADLFFV